MASPAGDTAPHRACLLDALGTTVLLRPPWTRIDPALVAGLDDAQVQAAFRAEMSFYAAHAHEARDANRLAELRGRCAELLSAGLGRRVGTEALMASIAFEAYPDARPALKGLRDLGLRLVCVSNWDCALPAVLDEVGLADLFDGIVASATAGARKPDPAIFATALEIAGCGPQEALHVGDSDVDVEGARAAGIDVLRIGREGGGDIASLEEIAPLLRPGTPIEEHSPR